MQLKCCTAWRVGQAAKTPPFHGGNTGSIPVRVTNVSHIRRHSSAGRALASHARGHRFEFCCLHHKKLLRPHGLKSFLFYMFLFYTSVRPLPHVPRSGAGAEKPRGLPALSGGWGGPVWHHIMGSRAAPSPASSSPSALPIGTHTAGTRIAATMASGTPLATTMPSTKPSTASTGIPCAAA